MSDNPNISENSFRLVLGTDGKLKSFDPGETICVCLGYAVPGKTYDDHTMIAPLPDSLETLICTEDIPEIKSIVSRRDNAAIRMRLRTSAGSYRWFEVFLTITRDNLSGRVYASGTAQDIQDEVEREKLLREKLAVLSKLEESEAALRQEKEKTKKEAIRSNRMLSKLSHDLRTAMNSILGFTELALDPESDTESVRTSLLEIRSAGQSLMHLLDELVDLGRIHSGDIHVSKEKFVLATAIESVYDVLYEEFASKGLTLTHDESDVVHHEVVGDPLCIKQVLSGLLITAIETAPAKGSISLTVREEQVPTDLIDLDEILDGGATSRQKVNEARSARRFIFEVSCSVDEPETPDVPDFEEIVEIADESSPAAQSLFAAKKFISVLGGDFAINRSGKTTTWVAGIPLSTEEVEPSFDETLIEETARTISGMHVLLVEDNAVNLTLEKNVLRKRNITFDEAHNGLEAVRAVSSAEAGKYDLILMDIRMPVMDGCEAADRIRMLDDPRLSSVPILAMTADAFEEDRKRCFDHGMDGYISKPFKPDQLAAAIEKATRGNYRANPATTLE
ncbi:MAG: response regulator [Lachnospiraceae bacterium]|nr:response regulator [Lachnospiraceae bacterium]